MQLDAQPRKLERLVVLQEIEDVIRAMPPREKLHWNSDDILEWLGRATAAIEHWGDFKGVVNWNAAIEALRQSRAFGDPVAKLVTILHQARNDLRLQTVGPVNLSIGKGYVFAYHDEVRKIIEQGKSDLLFIDRYLNGEFVSKFLGYVSDGVMVRLLAWDNKASSKHLLTLVESAKAFSAQHGTSIEIRVHADIHDRFLFVDGRSVFASGSSFKDGPSTAGATIEEKSGSSLRSLIDDHEALWSAARVELKVP